jgi:DNA-binding MarR family transcriptional regulator
MLQPATARGCLAFEKTLEVRDTCLCLFVQRAARALARRFDAAFRPLGLTHGQFSLLMALNRPHPPVMREVAALLGMDRTTVTAALKSLERRALVAVRTEKADRRSRRLVLTPAGAARLACAYRLWKAAHGELEAALGTCDPARLRGDLAHLASLANPVSSSAEQPIMTKGSPPDTARPGPGQRSAGIPTRMASPSRLTG